MPPILSRDLLNVGTTSKPEQTTLRSAPATMGKAIAAGAASGPPTVVDREELESAVRALLCALGEDTQREGIADTPKRVAKAMEFALRGYGMSAVAHVESALFHEQGLLDDETGLADARRKAGGVSVVATDVARRATHELSAGTAAAETLGGNAVDPSLARPGVVLIRDVPFFSTDEATLLPFYGVCHVGYVPSGGTIVGLSKVARVAEVFARRVQTPARLASDVAHALHQGSNPKGVRVIVAGSQMAPTGPKSVWADASIGCLAIPGDEASETSETKSADDDALEYRVEFEAMLHHGVGAGPGPPVGLTGLASESGKSVNGIFVTECDAADARRAKRPRQDLGAGAGGVARTSDSGSDDGGVVLCALCVSNSAQGRTGDATSSERGARRGGDTSHNASGSGRSASLDSEDGDTTRTRIGGRAGFRFLRDSHSRPATPSGVEAYQVSAGSPTESAEATHSGTPACVTEHSGSDMTMSGLVGATQTHAPEAAHVASQRMAKALGLHKHMTPERFASATKAYADVMAASRAGHAMDLPVRMPSEDHAMNDLPTTSESLTKFERDLELATLCEHHLLPFHGAVHVEYALGGGHEKSRPLSRLETQQIVTRHGRRFQVQERLTRDIARDVLAMTKSVGVMVSVRASHLCMIARGVEKPGSTTVTSAALGVYAAEPGRRARFWQTLAMGSG